MNGELAHDGRVAAHVRACARCTQRLTQHRRERDGFRLPLRDTSHRVLSGRVIALAVASAALAVAAVLVVVGRSPDASPVAPQVAAATRTKGGPMLGVFVNHANVVRIGGTGEVAYPDDALQFATTVDRPTYLTIVSLDHAGHASVYYPDGTRAAPVLAGAMRPLPTSVVLDGVLGAERIVGVFCDRPILVTDAIVAVAGTSLPSGCVTDTLTLEKRASP